MRIFFTAQDLGRVRVVNGWDPLSETVCSVAMLRRREHPWLNPWRAATRSGVEGRMRPLLGLVPAEGWIPDFLFPPPARQLRTALEGVRSAPDEHVHADLTRIAAERALPPAARALADGRPRALGQVADAIAGYHHLAIAPHQDTISACIDADRALRARTIAGGGLDLLLATLHPTIRWAPPCLEILTCSPRAQVHLAGHGLLLTPQVFARRAVLLPASAGQAPVLYYPIPDKLRIPAFGSRPARGPDRLAPLLGPTRARALGAVAAGCTTTELARQLGVTPATASEHAAILRNAGLILTQRHRNTVLHTLTPLGHALLRTGPGPY